MKTMRILSIIPYKILPAKLGGEKGIAIFNEYLGQLVPLAAVGTKDNEISEAKNYKILPLLSTSKLRYANIFLYYSLRRLIRQNKATHLIIEHPYYGWLAWLLRRTLPITLIVHSHNIEYMRSKSIGRWWWKLLKVYERWVYKKADINFFISEDDREHAIQFLGIDKSRSYPVTYGIEIAGLPEDEKYAEALIRKQHNIDKSTMILLFNGALYHHTNYDALSVILDVINPFLLTNKDLSYKIIVCGKGLPAFFNNLDNYKDKNIIYAGFVDDINLYFKAADIFLNPIISGGGVKTKAIEAIAMNCTVVSTEIGALGLKREACGEKLLVSNDNDWSAFNRNLKLAFAARNNTPEAFFHHYYWGNISRKVVEILNDNHAQSH